jgi:signal transduction histidine kinase
LGDKERAEARALPYYLLRQDNFFTIYVPIIDERGDLTQVLGISHDITAIRNTEAKLRLALEEKRKQNRILNTLVEEMKSNYDEIEQLLYMISHDLMTPLITISGFLEFLKKDVEKCNRIRVEIDLGLIGDAVSRMHSLLAKSLEIFSPGMLSSPREIVPFEEILNDTREHFKNICDSASSELLITADEGFPPVYAHKRRIVDISDKHDRQLYQLFWMASGIVFCRGGPLSTGACGLAKGR